MQGAGKEERVAVRTRNRPSQSHWEGEHVPAEMANEPGIGDVWTWTAIDAETKLVPSFYVGNCSARDGYAFMTDLAARLARRVRLTTDGHRAYIGAVEGAFGSEIDYAMLVKIYEHDQAEKRYGPAECIGTEIVHVTGDPDPDLISTSYVERQNLTMRMGMRRFTLLPTRTDATLDRQRRGTKDEAPSRRLWHSRRAGRCRTGRRCPRNQPLLPRGNAPDRHDMPFTRHPHRSLVWGRDPRLPGRA